MKKLIKNLFLFAFLAITLGKSITVTAQSVNITFIEGKIDTTLVRERKITKIGVKIDDFNNAINKQEDLIWSEIAANGSFQISFESNKELTYISFEIGISNRNNLSHVPLLVLNRSDALGHKYLLSTNEKYNLEILKDGQPRFYGTNADILNLQKTLYTFPSFRENCELQIMALSKQGKDKELWTLFADLLQNELSLKKAILNAFKNQLDTTIYKLLYIDLLAKTQHDFILKNITPWFMLVPSKRIQFAKEYDDFMTKLEFVEQDVNEITRSAYYADFILLKEQINYVKNANTVSYRGDSYLPIMNNITVKYNGKFREQLLVKSIVKLNRIFPTEVYSMKDRLLGYISDSPYKSETEVYFNKLNGQAFNFELPDANGRIHRLTDFKGKVVIMDFWFTGCTYCKILASNMAPILDSLKHKDLVVISVCLDKNRAMWLKSLQGGGYTNEGGLDLYTDGMGFDHPLPRYYGFIGAPQLLVIDKNGIVVPVLKPMVTGHIIDRKKEGVTVMEHPRVKDFVKTISNLLL